MRKAYAHDTGRVSALAFAGCQQHYLHKSCASTGAVLPSPSAPVGRGVDGIDAMA
jgi:hypothetical protein